MKIGILTTHRAHNYGAVLQAFALQSFLKSRGYDVEMIDYWPKYRKGHYVAFDFSKVLTGQKNQSLLSWAKQLLKEIISLPNKLIKHAKFETFIKENFKTGKNFYESGAEIPDIYDVIICGSDQIWRHNYRDSGGFDEVYFAKYPTNKHIIKLSYAASIGDKELQKNQVITFSKLLKHFDSISVREEPLQTLISSIESTVPPVVLDPVFLLPVTSWTKMIKPRVNKRKYLLFYKLLESREAANIAKKIASERELQILEITGSESFLNPFHPESKHTTGPIDFISLIANADFIVCTSYHGVLFSIIFQKNFLTPALGYKGRRINSLLKSLGINLNFDLTGNSLRYNEIDYSLVNSKLEELKEYSKAFLERSIRSRDLSTKASA